MSLGALVNGCGGDNPRRDEPDAMTLTMDGSTTTYRDTGGSGSAFYIGASTLSGGMAVTLGPSSAPALFRLAIAPPLPASLPADSPAAFTYWPPSALGVCYGGGLVTVTRLDLAAGGLVTGSFGGTFDCGDPMSATTISGTFVATRDPVHDQ